jgi:RNA polymerase sigma-70 factor (ECF subfamily)
LQALHAINKLKRLPAEEIAYHTMTLPPSDSTIELRLTSAAESSHGSAEVESVVIHLFSQFHSRLTSYVLAFGLSQHDAEDIVQETFLSLFHHLERFRPRWNLHGWLFRVAHNLALKRRQANHVRALDHDHEEILAQHPDPAHNAEEHLAFTQKQQRLRAVFEALPEQDQRCLHLRAEGLKYREIAQILGISLGAVSLSLSRSLARMARATGGE